MKKGHALYGVALQPGEPMHGESVAEVVDSRHGVDVYFDNAGGDVLAAALANLAMHARVILCGMIDAYIRDTPPASGPFLRPVVAARVSRGSASRFRSGLRRPMGGGRLRRP